MSPRLQVARVELREANAFVEKNHRHHGRAQGHRFSVGCSLAGRLVGVAIAGRPVARRIDQVSVIEVTRLVTDGTRNACSFLYTRVARAAQEMGFRAVITYTLAEEDGASLRACGWWPEFMDEQAALWSRPSRKRDVTKGQGLGRKVRWLWLTGVDAVED